MNNLLLITEMIELNCETYAVYHKDDLPILAKHRSLKIYRISLNDKSVYVAVAIGTRMYITIDKATRAIAIRFGTLAVQTPYFGKRSLLIALQTLEAKVFNLIKN